MSTIKFEGFIKFIISVLKRPAMYCVNNVEDIYLISFGYTSALQDDNTADFMNDFRQYVNKDFEMNGNHDWSRIIRFHSGSDRQSIELFSKLFFDYLENKKIVISNQDENIAK